VVRLFLGRQKFVRREFLSMSFVWNQDKFSLIVHDVFQTQQMKPVYGLIHFLYFYHHLLDHLHQPQRL